MRGLTIKTEDLVFRRCHVLLVLFVLCLAGCGPATTRTVSPPQAGVAVAPDKPIWLSGIQSPDNTGFKKSYPAPQASEFMSVVNAGIWLANSDGEASQLRYEFTVDVRNLPIDIAYTRATLENPEAPDAPIVYEHYITRHEKSSRVTHGPLHGVVSGREYRVTMELFHDRERTRLMDRVEQRLLSGAGNAGGCVTLDDEYKAAIFGNLPSPRGESIALDKVAVYCEK